MNDPDSKETKREEQIKRIMQMPYSEFLIKKEAFERALQKFRENFEKNRSNEKE